MRKFKKAGELKGGSRFIHVLATCPTGWRIGSEMSVKIARLAVQTNVFPLYEVEDGIRYTLNFRGEQKVNQYFASQGRFKHLAEADINLIQEQVDAEWDLLLRKASPSGYPGSTSRKKRPFRGASLSSLKIRRGRPRLRRRPWVLLRGTS